MVFSALYYFYSSHQTGCNSVALYFLIDFLMVFDCLFTPGKVSRLWINLKEHTKILPQKSTLYFLKKVQNVSIFAKNHLHKVKVPWEIFGVVTLFVNYSKCRIWNQFWHFSFRLSKYAILGIFQDFLSTQYANAARFARNVECDFFLWFSNSV